MTDVFHPEIRLLLGDRQAHWPISITSPSDRSRTAGLALLVFAFWTRHRTSARAVARILLCPAGLKTVRKLARQEDAIAAQLITPTMLSLHWPLLAQSGAVLDPCAAIPSEEIS